MQKEEFEEKNKYEYEMIPGNNHILFIKTGFMGNIYGYKNRYIDIAISLHQKYGYSVYISRTISTKIEEWNADKAYIENYIQQRQFSDYNITFLGFSKGGVVGLLFATLEEKIGNIILINAPLMVNTDKIIYEVKALNNKFLTFIYSSFDVSHDYYKYLKELENDKIKIITIEGLNHNFRNYNEEIFKIIQNDLKDKSIEYAG